MSPAKLYMAIKVSARDIQKLDIYLHPPQRYTPDPEYISSEAAQKQLLGREAIAA